MLTYWALRKAGVPRRRAACGMVAFLVLTYFVYLAALVVFGVLLRTGVLHGQEPLAGTVVPAAISGGIIVLFLMIAAIPDDFERESSTTRADTGGPGTSSESRPNRRPSPRAREPRSPTSATRSAACSRSRRGGFWAANIRDPVGGLQGIRRERALRRRSCRASSWGWPRT